MVQNGLDIPPERLLVPEINEKEKPGRWQEELHRVGARLGAGRKTIQRAIQAGQKQEEAFLLLTREGQGLTTPEAIERLAGRPPAKRRFSIQRRGATRSRSSG